MLVLSDWVELKKKTSLEPDAHIYPYQDKENMPTIAISTAGHGMYYMQVLHGIYVQMFHDPQEWDFRFLFFSLRRTFMKHCFFFQVLYWGNENINNTNGVVSEVSY